MKVVVNILFVLLVIISVLFILVTVLLGSKSDVMSGGSGQIRTTFKGKAGFDDFVSRLTLYLGIAFMALCVVINVIQTRGWDK
jgi:preprotein translocase subunit SecG